MGCIPYCNCYSKKKQVIIKSEIFIPKMESNSNIYNKELNKISYSNVKEKIDSDLSKSTLSPEYNNFINPLPDIVVIKYKNH